jgi:glyoxylase-like metal-dependent hydrolase (beta-lactamase superfamily II)
LSTAPAAIQKEDAPYLQEGRSAPVIPQSGLGKLLVKATGADKAKEIVPPLFPKLIVEDRYDLEEIGLTGKLVHTPGHTAGGLTVYIPELRAACIGDLLMRSLFIFGRAGLPKIAESHETVVRSLEKLLALDIETFYASHGGAIPRKDVERLV